MTPTAADGEYLSMHEKKTLKRTIGFCSHAAGTQAMQEDPSKVQTILQTHSTDWKSFEQFW